MWSLTLAEFREKVAGADPVPAGVAISAVSASLALGLVAKVLLINRKRGDAARIDAALEAARRESGLLAELAEADIRAFNRYMDCLRRKASTAEAMRDAVDVPMQAVRAAVRGIGICDDAAVLCPGRMTAADLVSAKSLLSGAARAIIASVEANLGQFPDDDSFRRSTAGELALLKPRLDR